jgi:catechol 2,3-dioxygenase-like lactoylglutathione lyase family enzyme
MTLATSIPGTERSSAMSSTANTMEGTDMGVEALRADLKLEVVVIPVSNPDRSKAFYSGLGWRLDADFAFDNGYRVVQFTPPGSPASVQFGTKITESAAGSARGLYLIVSDIEAARAELVGLGVEISVVFHPGAPGAQFTPDGAGRVDGPDPEHTSYGSFAAFRDPDGNEWLLQEVTERASGRIDQAGTEFSSVSDLANAMRRASEAHGEHEKRMGGEYDVNWPDWYAAYMVAEQAGTELPT